MQEVIMSNIPVNCAYLHDAEIISIAIDHSNKLAKLGLRKQDGTLHFIELYGVKAFRSEDLTLQNVVNRILQSSKDKFSPEELERWLQWVTSLSDAGSWLSEERRLDWRTACEAGRLDLVIVEPSAGVQVAALCELVVLN